MIIPQCLSWGDAVRKRHLFFAAAAMMAGLAVLGTVAAQAPPAPSASPPNPLPVISPPAQPLPNHANRPRLTQPVMAGPDGVRPAAGVDLPPPSMDLSSLQPPLEGESRIAPLRTPAATMAPPVPNATLPPVMTPLPSLPATGTAPSRPPVVPAPLPVPGVGGAGMGAGNTNTPPQPLGQVTPVGPVTPASPPSVNPIRESNPPALGATDALRPSTIVLSPATNAGPTSKITQTVSLEAVCPETVEFGSEYRYELIVRNTGTTAAASVRVDDQLPGGAKYLSSEPAAEVNGERMSWPIGSLEPGDEKRIVVRVQPSGEGEVAGRATVSYSASVVTRTKITRPKLAVTIASPELSRVGEDVVFRITVTNSGTGPAQQVLLQAYLTGGLFYPDGPEASSDLQLKIPNLAAGDSRTVPLKVRASKAGVQSCQVAVAAQGSPDATAKASVNVVEPILQITQKGPEKCFVRAEPTYEITLSNPGTASTDPIAVYAYLPEGFEFIQGSDGASFNEANRVVIWKLAALGASASKPITVKLRAAAEGEGFLRTIAQSMQDKPADGFTAVGGVAPIAGRVLKAETQTAIKAEGVAAVRFEVRDLEDPVPVGGEAVYEIRVINQGTGSCTNVQLLAALPEGTEYTGASGPTPIKAQGQALVFDPIKSVAAKGEAIYRVKVRGTVASEKRFRVQITCDQARTPVVKEEITQFVKQ